MKHRILSVLLVVAMLFSMSTVAFAQSADVGGENIATATTKYTVDDVKALEPYVYVENGNFMLDKERAIADNVDEVLLDGQQDYFDILNNRAEQGKIIINEDLSIVNTEFQTATANLGNARAGHWYSCGGGRNTNTVEYWWGYSRYACDCETQRMAADFNSCASVAAGVGVVGAYFGAVGAIPGGLASSYWWLLASRLDANNHGRGVFVEMTWILVFDITPQ